MPMQSRETCDRCDKKFPGREALRKHILDKHIQGFACGEPGCDKKFAYEGSRDNHVLKKHPGGYVVQEAIKLVTFTPTPTAAPWSKRDKENGEEEGGGEGSEVGGGVDQVGDWSGGDGMDIDEVGIVVEQELELECKRRQHTEELRSTRMQSRSQSVSSGSESSDSESENGYQKLVKQAAEQRMARAKRLSKLLPTRASPQKADPASAPLNTTPPATFPKTPQDISSLKTIRYEATPIQNPIEIRKAPLNPPKGPRATECNPPRSSSASYNQSKFKSPSVQPHVERKDQVSHSPSASSPHLVQRSGNPTPTPTRETIAIVSKDQALGSAKARGTSHAAAQQVQQPPIKKEPNDNTADDETWLDMDVDSTESPATKNVKMGKKRKSKASRKIKANNEEEATTTDEEKDWKSVRKKWKKTERKIQNMQKTIDDEEADFEKDVAKLKKNNKALLKMIKEAEE